MDQEQIIDELYSRAQIHETLVRYCRGVDRLDRDLVVSAFHEDAVDQHQGLRLEGAETIADTLLSRQLFPVKRTTHNILNHYCRLVGEQAVTETYMLVYQVREVAATNVLQEIGGRYVDRFERRDGNWKIAEQAVVIEYKNWRHFTDVFADADVRAETPSDLNPQRDKSDASYRFLRALGPDASLLPFA